MSCWCGGWIAGAESVTDLLATLQELEHLGVGFVSLTEALDLTTPAGRAMAGLLAIFADNAERAIMQSHSAKQRCGLRLEYAGLRIIPVRRVKQSARRAP